MKASELIKELQKFIDEGKDLQVVSAWESEGTYCSIDNVFSNKGIWIVRDEKAVEHTALGEELIILES